MTDGVGLSTTANANHATFGTYSSDNGEAALGLDASGTSSDWQPDSITYKPKNDSSTTNPLTGQTSTGTGTAPPRDSGTPSTEDLSRFKTAHVPKYETGQALTVLAGLSADGSSGGKSNPGTLAAATRLNHDAYAAGKAGQQAPDVATAGKNGDPAKAHDTLVRLFKNEDVSNADALAAVRKGAWESYISGVANQGR